MAAIAEIDTRTVDIPAIRPRILALATMQDRSNALAQVRNSDGFGGIGEGAASEAFRHGEEDPEGLNVAIESCTPPDLETSDPARVGAAAKTESRCVLRRTFPACAVEAAWLGMPGKRSAILVSELIGEARARDSLLVCKDDGTQQQVFRSKMRKGYGWAPSGAFDQLMPTHCRSGNRPAHGHFFTESTDSRRLASQRHGGQFAEDEVFFRRVRLAAARIAGV